MRSRRDNVSKAETIGLDFLTHEDREEEKLNIWFKTRRASGVARSRSTFGYASEDKRLTV